MTLFYCYIRFRASGVRSLTLPDDFEFTANFSNQGEKRRNVTFSKLSVAEGIRDTQNIAINWGGARSSLKIVPVSPPKFYGTAEPDNWSLLASFEVRGMELESVDLRGVTVVSEGGTTWVADDLTNFCEFCEKQNKEAYIEEVETNVTTHPMAP